MRFIVQLSDQQELTRILVPTAGLAGRVRLSRPADSPSQFAPSAVFSSSHGLNRTAQGVQPGGGLLPSQTVRAIDQQRQNLVAYEYLCHVAEFVHPPLALH